MPNKSIPKLLQEANEVKNFISLRIATRLLSTGRAQYLALHINNMNKILFSYIVLTMFNLFSDKNSFMLQIIN